MSDIYRDSAAFLTLLMSDCDAGTDDHAWRKCRRCLAVSELENRTKLAKRYMAVAIGLLSATMKRQEKRARYLEKRKAKTTVTACDAVQS